MSLQVEKLEKNMAKLTIETGVEEFEKAIEKAYQKQKSKISIPGFRKGKVPRQMVERMYGKEVFFEEAANILIPDAYDKALDECEEEIVSSPTIEVTQIEAGKPFVFTATVALKPEVKLGKYKGVKIEKIETEVTDEEVDAQLERERENNARNITVEDRPVEDGDMTTLDFEGFVDGVAFDGGKGENYPLTIGSGAFIPGFEEQLVGAKIGEETEVKVTFPEDYQAEHLQGKEAVFKCTVKEIRKKELPELNDEFAGEVSEFDTLAEYREDVKKNLEEQKAKDAKRAREDAAVKAVVEDSEMEIPEAMIEEQVSNTLEDYARRMRSQGLTMEQYMQFTGMTEERLREDIRPQAEKRIRTRLVLEAIVAAENIEAPEDAVEAEIKKMADTYKMEPDRAKELLGEEGLQRMKEDLAVQEAVDFLVAEAKLV